MDVEAQAHRAAVELLLTQLIAEYLRGTPVPHEHARYAREQLRHAAAQLSVQADSLEDEATLRLRTQEKLAEILDAALQRATATPPTTLPRDPENDVPG